MQHWKLFEPRKASHLFLVGFVIVVGILTYILIRNFIQPIEQAVPIPQDVPPELRLRMDLFDAFQKKLEGAVTFEPPPWNIEPRNGSGRNNPFAPY